MQQTNVYQTQRLMESGVDFNLVYSEKQSVIRDMTGFDFNLQGIVAFLKAQTDNFQKQDPLALDIDRNIKAIYDKWASKGEPTETPKEVPTETPMPNATDDKAEWNEASETLKMLISTKSGGKKEVAEWKEAIETLEMLLN